MRTTRPSPGISRDSGAGAVGVRPCEERVRGGWRDAIPSVFRPSAAV